MISRIFFTGLIVIGAFFLPWPVSVFLIILGMILFPFYIEALIPLLGFDFLYGLPQTGFFTGQFLLAIIGLGLIILIEYLRHRVVVYN